MTFFETLKAREAEYREFLARLIRTKDEEFRKAEQRPLMKKTKPIRHAKGMDEHNREWLWRDEIWCQDITLLAAEEFLGESISQKEYEVASWPGVGGVSLAEWLDITWDSVWDSLAKELDLPNALEG